MRPLLSHLTILDSVITEGGLRPISFLEQLFKLVELPITRPLEKALQRAKVAPRRFEFLSIAIAEGPDTWLRDASMSDVAGLLTESLPYLSIHSYVQLLRVIVTHRTHQVLTADIIAKIVSRLLELENWDLTVTVMEEIYRSNAAISCSTMNKVLHRASRVEPRYFLTIYDLFQRMGLTPNIVTIGIILLWNATKSTTVIGAQSAAHMTTYTSLKRIYEDGVFTTLSPSATSVKELGKKRQPWPADPVTLPDIRTKLTSGCTSLVDLVQVFCSSQCLQHQGLVIELAISSLEHFQFATKDVRGAIRERRYGQAHMMVLEWLITEAMRQRKIQLAINVAMYALAAEIGSLGSETISRLLLGALKEDMVLEAIDLAESCLAVAPDSITTGRTLSYIVKRAFDGGLQMRCLGLLAKLRENQSLIPPEVLIQSNLLILEDPDIFIRQDLGDLAQRSQGALDKALQCLSARNRHTAALDLFQKVKRKSPALIQSVHYGRALVAAASLNSPSKAKGQVYADFKLHYPEVVKGLEIACAKGKKVFVSHEKDDEGRLSALRSGELPAICGLAVSAAALPNYGLFSKRFFNLFSSVLAPNVEVIAKFLSMHLVRRRTSHNKRPTETENVIPWANFILPWMEHRGVKPTLPIYTRLLQLALRCHSKETIQLLAQELNQRKFRLTSSLYKALLKEISSYHTAKSVFESAENACVILGSKQYEVIIRLAMKEELYQDAYIYLEALHDRLQGKKDPLTSALARALLTQSFTKLPLTSFIDLLNRLHALGYLAPPEIYAEFIRVSVAESRPVAASSYFDLFNRACQNAPLARPVAFKEWDALIMLLTSRGMINEAYRIWRSLSTHRWVGPSLLSNFGSLLRNTLTSDVLACLPPPRPLEMEGPAQLVIDHVISSNLELPLQWARHVLGNSLATGSFDLARSLHLHLSTKHAVDGRLWPLSPGSTCLMVADLWSSASKHKII